MLKARYGVQLFACWPQRGTFMMQDFYSLWPLPTRVAAERAGVAKKCATPTRKRGQRQRSCALAGRELHCSFRFYTRLIDGNPPTGISFFPPFCGPPRAAEKPTQTPRGRANESAVGPGQFPERLASLLLLCVGLILPRIRVGVPVSFLAT
jgi:hypothetical protein